MSSPADPFQPDRRAFIGMAAAAGASLAAAGTLGTTEVLGAVPAGASVAFGFTYEELQSVLAIALSRGGDFADLYFERSRAVSLTLEDDRISRAYTSSDLGVGVRVVKGDSVGYAFSELLELPAIKKAASTAAAIADGVAKADVKPLKVAALPNYYSHDFRFASIDIDAKKKLVQDLNSKLKAKDPRVVKTTI
ncbi:MAG: TldD/PmbA family protein, partial [Myxococcales bacterium]|nr:TldD/PmbA family protein [Myxococcales bacterium]